VKIIESKRPGWFDVVEMSQEEFAFLKGYPGYEVDTKKKTVQIPINLVYGLPHLFDVEPVPAAYLEWDTLRPFQRRGAGLVRARGGALLAMRMGTGKTLTATAALALGVEKIPRTLIVGPLMSRGSWCGERSDPYKFFGIKTAHLQGRKASADPFVDASWVFCHYDILDDWFPFVIQNFKPEAVIIDECHIIKNKKTTRSKNLLNLMRLNSVKYRIGLSGTPILNSVMDLWAQLECVSPGAWGKRHEFGQRYTNVEWTDWGAKYTGQANVEELQKRLDVVMFKVEPHEVQAQLPSIVRQAIPVTLSGDDQFAYDNVYSTVRERLSELIGMAHGATEKLIALTRLTETVGLGKVQATANMCVEALNGHDKVVVFCWHKSTGKAICEAIQKAREYTDVFGPVSGEMSADKRVAMMDEFAATSNKAVFVATIASSGIALNNLVAASCAVFNDLYWVPAPLLQAEARVHRDGQKRGVTIYYMYAENTIDDVMLEKILTKAAAIEAANVGGEASTLASTLSGEPTSVLDDFISDILALDSSITDQIAEGDDASSFDE
jgi:SNF2 family DNA or RNA helicase